MPILLVVVWFAAAGIGGPYFGKIEEVSSNSPAMFLPEGAESTVVRDKLAAYVDDTRLPTLVVFESDDALTDEQLAAIRQTRQHIGESEIVSGTVSPPVVSDDGKAAFLGVPIASSSELEEVVPELQAIVDEQSGELESNLTGPAVFMRDIQNAFAGIDGTLLIVALSVVFVILLVVYRSPILPVLTLLGAMSALSAAVLAVYTMADADVFTLNGQVRGILFILVIGAATDYSLLYIARYREELVHYKSTWQATCKAWKASIEPILAAGGTVILGLLCLLASELKSNQTLGPVGSIGIVFSMIVALTFLPSALLLFGRSAFWPRPPKYRPRVKQNDYRIVHPAWSKVADFVRRYPRRIWIGITVLLLVACVGVGQFRAEGVSQNDLILGQSDARDGQAALDRHFAGGAGSPANVLVPVDEQSDVIDILRADEGVSTVTAIGESMPQVPVGPDAEQMRDQAEARIAALPVFAREQARAKFAAQQATLEPKAVDGMVALSATLTDDASGTAAIQTIKRLRGEMQPDHPAVQIGGVSAIQLDANDAAARDLVVLIPLILCAIAIVLMLLLRSIVAPLVLMLTTIVSFGSTIGIAALLFNNLWGYPGAEPAIVLFGFVFLVALGIDYNIFLMTRVREETFKLGVREGTLKALVVTGGVITSAGIVLAATFAALYVLPVLFLAQMAFIVSFGVLLDTLIVRSLLVPALTLEIGRPMWWPSRLTRSKKGK